MSPHTHGRVFAPAVGVTGDPVDDDWRADKYAAQHEHLTPARGGVATALP